ncbi:MAG: DNA gyrase subunit A [Proteobacteria bacterium]|nr:DNA gyrase subunit A [Pseudomonadota bacterium]
MIPEHNKQNISIEDELKRSYLDYAMSVIIGRALPDVRDGLKPVHRRILFAMRELKNDYNKAYKKSARIVGDVIGKYHPHGDSAVYDALVRMAQDFSMRQPLIDGQGNFGSVDGDPPAAMRYTEVRMAKVSGEFLSDLDKDTVDFVPNYDGSLTEPAVMPAVVPNLLLNGSSGIAVGMATNVPPHNLGELTAALIALIDRPDIEIEELMAHLPGPDFPTAGLIYGRAGIREAYTTGKGIIQVRARALVEKHPRTGREAIVINELPYQVNKARLLERIADLVRDKKIEGINDIRDESDRDGLRVVIELKRDTVAGVIMNQLYAYTQMKVTFGVIMLAIVNNRPEVLTLKEVLTHFVAHRREVIVRRTRFELARAEERAHILEGLKNALDHLDQVIAIIRHSPSPAAAKEGLMEELSLSERQAQAILDMRLSRLTALERDKINQEYAEVIKAMASFREILGSESIQMGLIRQEMERIRDDYADGRRTEIIDDTEELSLEDLIAEEEMVVTVSHSGYIKRNPITLYRSQHRGGRGKTGMATKEEDFVENLFVGSTHSYVLIFSTFGKLYWLKVHEIPQAGRAAKGKAIVNLVNMESGEGVATILPVRDLEEEGRYVVMVTRRGMIKKTPLNAFSRPRKGGIIAVNIQPGDGLLAARITDGRQHLFLGSRHGKAIRFKETEVRSMGRTAAGVKGMNLDEGDEVVGLETVSEGTTVLTVSEFGFGKRTAAYEYPVRGRGGKGVITLKTTDRNGNVVGVLSVADEDELMLIADSGMIIRLKVGEIKVIGRNTQGVKLIGLSEDQRVKGVARLAEKDAE